MHSDNAKARLSLSGQNHLIVHALASGFLHMNSRALSTAQAAQTHSARAGHTGDINPAPPFHPNGFFAPRHTARPFCARPIS